MVDLPGSEQAARQLRTTVLREFELAPERVTGAPRANPAYRVEIPWVESPVPAIMMVGLQLIGLPVYGPGEKVAWWVTFVFRGRRFELAHKKFGVRLWLTDPEVTAEEAEELLGLVRSKLVRSQTVVERLVNEASRTLVDTGDATVVNRHHRLQRTYEYFRERATTPTVVEDVHTQHGEFGSPGSWSTFVVGRNVMELNATHDMVAAVTAYLSRLEHDLVLALPFAEFDPKRDHLAKFIGSKWGAKFKRILGSAERADEMFGRLTGVVERWRNPYTHGGFEKGHGSTIYVHVPDIGALPIGLSTHQGRPVFSLSTIDELAMAEVFSFLDEFDRWCSRAQPYAAEWIRSGMDVRYDEEFRDQLHEAVGTEAAFREFIMHHQLEDDIARNMDY